MRLTFLGAVGTVTGSKYLIETDGRRVLVDCGLFQGYKQLRLRNWAPMPFDPAGLDAVLLTHAHLDHSGYLPLLVRNGFAGPVICTLATRDLCEILLSDSGHLLEKDADYANRHRFSKHRPALPLYTQKDAKASLTRFQPVAFGEKHELEAGLTVRFRPAGHILGASTIDLRTEDTTVVFSGDLGRPISPTMLDSAPIRRADYLVIESTYGDRSHDRGDPEEALADIITRTASRGGTVLVPAFAVGRAQSLLFHLQRLKAARRIPDLPVFLDSPMAINASKMFCKHLADQRLSTDECRATCAVARYVRKAQESKSLNENKVPKVLISASSMATGGRTWSSKRSDAATATWRSLFRTSNAGPGTRRSLSTTSSPRPEP
jgi:metallo-beta-lactamase family protein